MNKEIYDVIIPIGAACLNSLYLRKHLLQKMSYPFDWVGCYSIKTATDLICSDFQDFLILADLFETGYVYVDREGPCKFVQSKKTGILFGHDFPDGIEIAQSFSKIKEKYLRRIKRLNDVIQSSKKVLFFYMEENSPQKLNNNRIILRSQQRLQSKYPDKQVSLIYLSNDLTMVKGDIKDEKLSAFVRKITLNYHSDEFGEKSWIPDWNALKSAVGYLRLKKPFGELLYEKTLLAVSYLIIFRSMRRKFLRKCHLYV